MVKNEFLILATIPLQAKLTACGSSVEAHKDTAVCHFVEILSVWF